MRFNLAFGADSELWLMRQMKYDLWKAEQRRDEIDFVMRRRRFVENSRCSLAQLPLPVDDLVRMHVKLPRQFRQGFVARYCRQRHFGLESR